MNADESPGPTERRQLRMDKHKEERIKALASEMNQLIAEDQPIPEIPTTMLQAPPKPVVIETTKPVSQIPRAKIVAVGLAGAVTTIVMWGIENYSGAQVPADVAAAFTAVVGTVIGYLTPETQKEQSA
jgi:hypothetical protein